MGNPRSSDASHLWEMAQVAVADSERWFGDQPSSKSLTFTALCLCGEAGELANMLKKIEQGTLDPHAAGVQHKLTMEITDVLTYALKFFGMIGVDPEKAYELKRVENEARFTKARKERDTKSRQEKAMANGD